MVRVDFAAPDLIGFASASPDDHVKLFIDDPAHPGQVCARDYTPRAFDSSLGHLTIDFALHGSGPATSWAKSAKPGDLLEIGGPRGSSVVPDDFDHYLLLGDETAVPSIGRRLQALRGGVEVTTVIVVNGPEEAQTFDTAANLRSLWVFRSGSAQDDTALLRSALDGWRPSAGDGFVWLAAEARVARDLRDYMINDRGCPKQWVKAAGYWIAGKAGASDKGLEAAR